MKKKKKGLLTNELKAKLRNSRDDREILENLAVASKELDADDLYFVSGGAQYEADNSLRALQDMGSNISEATRNAISAILNSDNPVQAVIDGNGQDHQGATFEKVESGNLAVLSEDGNGLAIPVDINRDNGEGLHVNTGDGGVTLHDGNLDGADINLDNGELLHVKTGDDVDSFEMQGVNLGQIHSGDGDFTLDMDPAAQANAEISVDAGDGFDVMTLFGKSLKHSFTFENGKFHMK